MRNLQTAEKSWYTIKNADEIFSPTLLVYPEQIEKNIKKMISIAGEPDKLRPHVKTHKMPEIIKLQMACGINKFKCATIAECEMTAECGARDILLAYQPVGPNIRRFFKLRAQFPHTKISCIADCEEIVRLLSKYSLDYNSITSVWLDLNVGMNRTGITPGHPAAKLFRFIADSPMLIAEGLHVYDGHIREKVLSDREEVCNAAYKPVESLITTINSIVNTHIKVVVGGTPTFPIHAKRKDVETSPGTTLLWDWHYGSSFEDMSFSFAAILLTRIVSKPAEGLICIDLGHKAVASEMPHPRIKILNAENYEVLSHNEEHMVIRTPRATTMSVGDILYCVPYHICPTVDRYDKVSVVRNRYVTEQWNVQARKREITI